MERTRESILSDIAETPFHDSQRLRELAQELDAFETEAVLLCEDVAYRVWVESFLRGMVN